MLMFTLGPVLIIFSITCILFEIRSTPDITANQTVPHNNGTLEGDRRERNESIGGFHGDADTRNILAARSSPIPPVICNDSHICEDVSTYPQEFIVNILKGNKKNFTHFARQHYLQRFPVDSDVSNFFESRKSSFYYESLCDSHTKIIFPKAARTVDGEWVFVVNVKPEEDNEVNFRQVYQVEICTNPNGTCKTDIGYSTRCQQDYIIQQTLYVQNQQLVKGRIQIPAGCSCSMDFSSEVFDFDGRNLLRYPRASGMRKIVKK